MSSQDNQSPQEIERIVTKINIPEITNYRNEDDILLFTLKNTNVSIANGLRRTILSDVPTVVFRTFPYEKNLADFKGLGTDTKGELTVVLSKREEKYNLKGENFDEKNLKNEIKKYLKKYSLKDVVNLISVKNKLPKKKVYNLCLKMKK